MKVSNILLLAASVSNSNLVPANAALRNVDLQNVAENSFALLKSSPNNIGNTNTDTYDNDSNRILRRKGKGGNNSKLSPL